MAGPGIDHDALRERYRRERDKRLRPDGNDQYVEPTGRFAQMLADPFVAREERPAVTAEVDAVVIGAGFGGLATAAMLKEAGLADVRLVEAGGDVGGAWYWNRYPGAMCDTASMVYLPLLEETGHVPSMKYVDGQEIFEHARRIARHWALYDRALLATEVSAVRWDDASARWEVRTDRGDRLFARYLAMGTGPLHRPKLPGIEGLETFEGHSFHTSRWDYDYTGGSPSCTAMDRLADKRVGVIGTGATAVQAVPELARHAGELVVFQRTPSSIDVRGNHPIDPAWFATLEPGWQRRWLRNFAVLQTGGFADEDLVQDGWTDIAQRIRDRVVEEVGAGAPLDEATLARAYELSDDDKMEEIRARVDKVVADRPTAAALKPWYRQLCKRPCFHDAYLDAFNLDNVTLVDTDGAGVTRIDATGCWVRDAHHDVDCLIFATGFEVGTDYARRSGFEVTGRRGRALSDHWSDGMRSLHGCQVRGFPNLFVIGFAQGANLVSNITHNLVDTARTIAAVVARTEELGATSVEPSEAAEERWLGVIDGAQPRFLGNPECTPGYYNNEGRPMGPRERRNAAGFPAGPVAFFDYIEEWRGSGRFEGLEFNVPTRRAGTGASAPASSSGSRPA